MAHRWVLSYVYDLPFGKGKRISPSSKVADLLVSGWQMTGILTMQTGRLSQSPSGAIRAPPAATPTARI